MAYRVTHNGVNIHSFDDFAGVEGYIARVLEDNKELRPVEIYRSYSDGNMANAPLSTIKSVVIYQYYTLYTEVFMIEERGSREPIGGGNVKQVVKVSTLTSLLDDIELAEKLAEEVELELCEEVGYLWKDGDIVGSGVRLT